MPHQPSCINSYSLQHTVTPLSRLMLNSICRLITRS